MLGSLTGGRSITGNLELLNDHQVIDGRVFYSDQRSARDNGGRGRVPHFELTADGPTPAFTGIGTTWTMLRIR